MIAMLVWFNWLFPVDEMCTKDRDFKTQRPSIECFEHVEGINDLNFYMAGIKL